MKAYINKNLNLTEGRKVAVATFKKLWKNEYFQLAIMVVLMVSVIFGFWYGSQVVLNTQYPALAVVSTSMLPTLNVGDVIIVQGATAAQIYANYTTGDVIVYRSPYEQGKLIVHRAVEKQLVGSTYFITTKGDNNAAKDTAFNETYVVGKVIARIPYVGHFYLFTFALGSFYYFIVIVIIIINILLTVFYDTEEKDKSAKEEPREKRKLFGKVDIHLILLIIINMLLIGFIVFNAIGIFTFWQIGADPPQYVTIRGMNSDLQYHTTFSVRQNINEVFLSQGVLTYKIDALVNGIIRPGVPTFSWLQASILILLIIDLWTVMKFLKWDKKLRQALRL